jgi:hypothetical protein
MNLQQVMDTLRKMGTAQNVKLYKRHGAGGNLFRVSFANLNQRTPDSHLRRPKRSAGWPPMAAATPGRHNWESGTNRPIRNSLTTPSVNLKFSGSVLHSGAKARSMGW